MPAAVGACIALVAAAPVGAAVHGDVAVVGAAAADVVGAVALGVVCEVGGVAPAEGRLKLDLGTARCSWHNSNYELLICYACY